jgi:O-antigen/teichoic acid export membrane protein
VNASRNIAKNTALLTVGVLAGRALGVLVIRKMTPVLGEDGIGVWGAATDLVAILLVMTNFGLGTLLTREITRRTSMTLPLMWSVLKLRWLMGAAAYLFLFFFTRLSGFDDLKTAAFLVTGLAIFFESTAMACDAVLQAHEKVIHQTWGQLVSAVVYYVMAIWALQAGYGLMGIIWANAISRLVRLVVMVPLMLRTTGPWQWHDPAGGPVPTMFDMLRLGLPLFLATTFGILYNKIDTVMLFNMQGDVVSGIYVLGHRALDIMIIVPGLFGTALFPALARYGLQSGSDAARLGERSLRYMMVAILPLTLFLMFVAAPIINWFDPTGGFADSILVLMIVIWGLPLQAVCIILGRLLITANRERVFVQIGLVSMLFNVVLNTLLIPRYSYFGASWATIVSMTVSFLMHYYYVRKTELRPPLLRALWGPTLATVAAWLATAFSLGRLAPGWHITWKYLPVNEGWPAFLGSCSVMLVVYGSVLGLLRIFGGDDLRLLSALRRGRTK